MVCCKYVSTLTAKEDADTTQGGKVIYDKYSIATIDQVLTYRWRGRESVESEVNRQITTTERIRAFSPSGQLTPAAVIIPDALTRLPHTPLAITPAKGPGFRVISRLPWKYGVLRTAYTISTGSTSDTTKHNPHDNNSSCCTVTINNVLRTPPLPPPTPAIAKTTVLQDAMQSISLHRYC